MARLPRFVPLTLLLAYGVAFAAASLGAGVIAYDDHPGQLYRVWHVVREGFAPWRWNDGWWGGYPELQFYPPGFSYLAAGLHDATLGTLSVPASYQLLTWITYLAPGLTTFLLLTRVLGNGWLAVPAALVALTFSAGLTSGVEGGVHIGMVAARLGWAMLPLLALTLRPWTEGSERPSPFVPIVIAGIVLTHPTHLPAVIVLIVLAAVSRSRDRLRNGIAAIGLLAFAAALTAFWTLPLLARLAETRALAWWSESPAITFGHPLAVALALLAVDQIVRAVPWRFRTTRAVGSFHLVLSLYPFAMGLVGCAALGATLAGVGWLPVNRVADGFWIAVIVAAGIAIGSGITLIADRTRCPVPALSIAAIAVFVMLSLSSRSLTLWPRAADWPQLTALERGLRLPDLWAKLRAAPPGRILFVRSGVPLVHGTEWYRPHTHVTALTPVRTGRPIIHGTFTHASPIAALVYRGTTSREPLSELAEMLDGHTLFGRPLDGLSAASLQPFLDRFAISAIVAVEDDVPHLGRLETDPLFRHATGAPPFVLYQREAGLAIPTKSAAGRWTFPVDGPAGSWVSMRTTFYPLWKILDHGVKLPTRRGPLGDLEARLARSGGTTLELTYEPGIPEIGGAVVTALAMLAWLTWTLIERRSSGGSRELPSRSRPAAGRTPARSSSAGRASG